MTAGVVRDSRWVDSAFRGYPAGMTAGVLGIIIVYDVVAHFLVHDVMALNI